uniref:Carboxylesterase 6 n=1 Tax=Meteorus pulchricornis TaxID=51522 RepID=A0A4D6J7Q3_9HYME|nr:carboxylesterase 6 [Meteorus pulchricornis]
MNNYPITLVIIVFAHEFIFINGNAESNAQISYPRQRIGREPPTVTIPDQGILVGKEIPLARPQKVTVYLGVPYAHPPIGSRRFTPPVTDPPVSWQGSRNATQFASSCQQVSDRRKLHESLYRRLLPPTWVDPGVSEDCLYLNIYIPDGTPPSDGWPVMVWFHGGDFNTGTPAIWDATIFVNEQKILVVTVAYRLNIFGFFTTTDAEAPGNYGMLDQVAALDWIQRNIKQFEGSPQNVVIAGHSSGAISVGLHMLSPLSKGKFTKAIAMSGDAIGSVRTPELEAPIVDQVADRFTCFQRPRSALMECLRRLPAAILLKETSDIETWGPIVDVDTNNSTEPFLPMHPKDIINTMNFNPVPLITGYTSNEQALAYLETAENPADDGKLTPAKFDTLIRDEIIAAVRVPGDNTTMCESKPHTVADAVLFLYRPYPPTNDSAILRDRYLHVQTDKNYAAGLTLLASKVSERDKQAYVYRFDYRPRTSVVARNVPDWAGVPHMFELPFVWGLPHTFPSVISWDYRDKDMARVMMTMIANFVRTGSPSLLNVRWEPYTDDVPGILIINTTINMSDVNAIDYRALAFWNEYYPLLVEESMNNCCNITYSTAATLKTTSALCITFSIIAMTLFPLIYV